MDENRIAILAIIITDTAAVDKVNAYLHDYAQYILARLGLPVRNRGVNTISLVLDAPVTAVNALSGKLGAVVGVRAKALFTQ